MISNLYTAKERDGLFLLKKFSLRFIFVYITIYRLESEVHKFCHYLRQ